MPDKFFISDTHFFHENIIRFSGRPYNDVTSMNEDMIRKWNNIVGKNDTVYHLGDVAFKTSEKRQQLDEIFYHLNGRKILYLGNHDIIYSSPNQWKLADYFERIQLWGIFQKEDFFCSHIPLEDNSDNFRNVSFQLHGHIHQDKVGKWVKLHPENLKEDWKDNPKYINVCVEHTGYAPKPLDEIMDEIKQRKS